MYSCGIDFGTSNSAIVAGDAAGVSLIPVEGSSDTLPSAVFFPSSGGPAFGRRAQKLFFEAEEGRFMRSLKRILGTSLMGQGTVVNGRMVKFDDIIGKFIAHIKTTAEEKLQQELTHVVMGRPVHFIDGDDAGDKRAQDELERIARSVGFTDISFQFEPIAAAFSHERQLTSEKLAIVVDVGGGTSDFTVIRLGGDKANKLDRSDDILGNAGVRTGGNDFDKSLSLEAFMPELGYGSTYGEKSLTIPLSPFHDMSEWSKINFLYTPKSKTEMRNIHAESKSAKKFGRFVHALEHELGHRTLSAVEDAKIGLTTTDSVAAPMDFIEKDFSVNVDVKTFNRAVDTHIGRIDDALMECLARANVQSNSIDMIVLTGGPTETPVLKNTVRKRFPAAEMSEENKMSSVALGLGYDSLRKFGT